MRLLMILMLMLIGLTIALSAATCSEKNEIYSEGYNGVTQLLKKEDDKTRYEGDMGAYRLSLYTQNHCNDMCTAIIWGKSKSPSDKKYNSCVNSCINAAKDAASGLKPKMKLCE